MRSRNKFGMTVLGSDDDLFLLGGTVRDILGHLRWSRSTFPFIVYTLSLYLSRSAVAYSCPFFCQRFQFIDDPFLIFRNYITGFKIIFDVNTHAGFFKVADMAIAAINLKIFSKDLFNGLRFSRAFNY